MSRNLKLKGYEKKFIELIENNKKIINKYKDNSYEIRQDKISNILYDYTASDEEIIKNTYEYNKIRGKIIKAIINIEELGITFKEIDDYEMKEFKLIELNIELENGFYEINVIYEDLTEEEDNTFVINYTIHFDAIKKLLITFGFEEIMIQ